MFDRAILTALTCFRVLCIIIFVFDLRNIEVLCSLHVLIKQSRSQNTGNIFSLNISVTNVHMQCITEKYYIGKMKIFSLKLRGDTFLGKKKKRNIIVQLL